MRLPPVLALLAPRTAPRALAWYLALTVAFTWPVAAGLARDVPRDLGDPLLNCWILGWNADHYARALGGDPAVLRTLWHGNMFHPERYVLAYSELLAAQSLQILPVYVLTGNLVLCYNLLFLSTFVLSGLGMFLLVRGYVRDWRIALVAGLLFAFTPYRVNQAPHLQVMSSQWMPFALHGFHRFVETRRWPPLVGGSAALVAQNLSCGYFLVYFSLFVPLFVLFEIGRARAWTTLRVWAGFGVAGAVAVAATLPFMQPYLALRDLRGTRRSLHEMQVYSADVWGWLTAEPQLTVWGGWLRVYERPEGTLFPGALPLLLAAVGVAFAVRRAWHRPEPHRAGRRAPPGGSARLQRARRAAGLLAILAAVASALGLLGIVTGWLVLPARVVLRVTAATVVVTLVASSRARAAAARAARSPLAFAVTCAGLALFLSLGPHPTVGGAPLGSSRPFLWLSEHVPGFDGLRVPARFAMVATLFLSWAAAYGVRDLVVVARSRRVGTLTAALLAALWMADAWSAPFPVNDPITSDAEGIATPPSRVAVGSDPPALARALQQLPPDAVIAAFPFGVQAWDMRHVYESTMHWRRLVNGFSGYAPPWYDELAERLRDPQADPKAAWEALQSSGATHVLVRGQAYFGRVRPAPHAWLEANGLRPVARIGMDELYELPR